MVWDFKRSLYCSAHNLRTYIYMEIYQKKIYKKKYNHILMDKKGIRSCGQRRNIPSILKSAILLDEDREYYIQKIKCEDVKPALGYLCLGELIISGKIDVVSTTNFDDLIQAGIHAIDPGISIKTISSAVSSSVGIFVV